MTSFNLTSYLSRNADNVMIGWARGGTELGFYDRAYKLVLFPIIQVNGTVGQVLVPVLSRMRGEPDRYLNTYRRALGQLLLITAPGIVTLFVNAETLIQLLLGPNWLPAVPIFQWLCLAGAHQIASNTFGVLFVTQQRTNEYAKLGVFNAITTILAFAVGLPWGAVGVASAYAISGVLIRLPAVIWLVGSRGPVSRHDIVMCLWPYVAAMVVSFGAWSAIAATVTTAGVQALLASVFVIYAVSWLVLLTTRAGRRTFADTLELARELTRRGP
jgi:PST family polysaccharide transporter